MIQDHKESFEPQAPKLLSLAARVIIDHANQLLSNTREDWPELRQDDSEAILNEVKHTKNLLTDDFFENFIDGSRFPTSILPIGTNLISDETFARLLVGQARNLREINLYGNKSLGTKLLLDYLLEFKDELPRLETLIASNQWFFNVYKDCTDVQPDGSVELPQKRSNNMSSDPRQVIHFTQFFPHLQSFKHTLVDDFCSAFEKRAEFISRVLHPLRELRTLELNNWSKLKSMDFLPPISNTLTTLRLYNYPHLSSGLHNIMELKNLEFLDISQASASTGEFERPALTLYSLISSFPNLKRLDIANTNLCLPFDDETRPEEWPENGVDTDIHGLRPLQNNLEFLSVFRCEGLLPTTKLPAYCICSELSEESLLVALETYQDRPELLQIALNELFQNLRSEEASTNRNNPKALYLVLEALANHPFDRMLQISGTAALFYAIRNHTMDPIVKRRVVEIMINAIENFNDEPVVVRNCCLAFCQINIPQDVVFIYSKMISLLVRILNSHSADATTPRVVIYLLNSLACQTGHDCKIEAGTYGAIQAVMSHIQRKIERNICDETVEVSFSFLWNITDETESNCKLFLRENGLNLFLRCYTEFPSRKDLVRNMLGLIGNIAECSHLRSFLMQDQLIQIFLDLLNVLTDGIETSYNSAGVLSQLLSDGDWSNVKIDRDYITNRIIETTKKWPLDSKRFINYRSFAPILKLLPMWHSVGSQVWALYAIANLTTTDREKYVEFVLREGGVEILEQIQQDPRSTELMITLTRAIFENISLQTADNCSPIIVG